MMQTLTATHGDTTRLLFNAQENILGMTVTLEMRLNENFRVFSGEITSAAVGQWQCLVATPEAPLNVGLWRARAKYVISGEVGSEERFLLNIEERL